MKNSAFIITLTLLSAAIATAGEPAAKAPIALPAPPCLTYDYIDLDYGITDHGNSFLDDRGDRYGISFSKSLGEVFFLTGGYTNASVDYLYYNQYDEIESHRYTIGLGAHFSLSECVDLTIEGGADHRDARFDYNSQFNYDSWGYYVGPGIRARAGRFEGFAKVFYVGREGALAQYGADFDGWLFQPGVLFHLTDHLALKVAADLGQHNSAVTFGARVHF